MDIVFVAGFAAVVGLGWLLARHQKRWMAEQAAAKLMRCPACGHGVPPDETVCDACGYIPAIGRRPTPEELAQAKASVQADNQAARDRKSGCLWIVGLATAAVVTLAVVAVGIFAFPLPTIALCAVVLVVWLVFFRRG